MILAKNNTAQYYKGIHPNLDTALEHINDDFFATLGTERVDIVPGKVWCTAFSYDTIPDEESFFEAHEMFLDIHIMLSGSERVEIASPKNLEVFRSEEENDFWGYRGKGDYSLVISPGSFLVVFPDDAHKIKMQIGNSERVRKAVFKVKIKE